jgi:hypothetical protein
LDPIEWKLRCFGAAFYIRPQFRNWVRTRARELERAGERFEIILVWGRRRFRVGALPHGDPYFAIERVDGTVERSRWAE